VINHGKTKLVSASIILIAFIFTSIFIIPVFAAIDKTPPKISGVSVPKKDIKNVRVKIIWNTDEPASSKVEYGTGTSYGKSKANKINNIDEQVTSHVVSLTGLTPNTIYHFRVNSKDIANNSVVSGDFTFTTAGGPGTPTSDTSKKCGDGVCGCGEYRQNCVSDCPKDWWKPKPGMTWQWQLQGTIDTSFQVDVYDLDLFDAPQNVINKLRAAGRKVICYFSAGSWEDWRKDEGSFPETVKGKENGWPGERWLDIRRIDILGPIMQARLQKAKSRGCDAVEPDNVDGYDNGTGFPLTYRDQLIYNQWLAEEAHKLGLSIGLKNDVGQVRDLEQCFDWALSEQAFQYNEYKELKPFVSAGKTVFGVEYVGYGQYPAVFCPKANAEKFSWLFKKESLDAWRQSCH